MGLAVEVVLDGGSWPWVALVGMEGLGGLGRPNAADRPDQRGASGRSGVWWTVFAELWLRKRATVYWSRLEQPEAGAERARSVSGGGGFLPAAERTVRHKMPSCGGDCRLWAALDGQRVQAVEQPCRRPEDAAVDQCTGQPYLRRRGGAA